MVHDDKLAIVTLAQSFQDGYAPRRIPAGPICLLGRTFVSYVNKASRNTIAHNCRQEDV